MIKQENNFVELLKLRTTWSNYKCDWQEMLNQDKKNKTKYVTTQENTDV